VANAFEADIADFLRSIAEHSPNTIT